MFFCLSVMFLNGRVCANESASTHSIIETVLILLCSTRFVILLTGGSMLPPQAIEVENTCTTKLGIFFSSRDNTIK